MNEDEKIKALINLLDDPDEQVYSAVSENIISKGADIIPKLENAWESTLDELLQERLENLIHKIQMSSASRALKEWMRSEDKDLLFGAFLIAKWQYPDLDYENLNEVINKIKQDIWLELNNNLTALEKVKILNHIIFEVHKFNKNISNYYAPQNSFINHVLESKKGNPISLSIIYSVIARRLDIPIYGVNLPRNFILAYLDIYRNDQRVEEADVLFYINPYNKGTVLNKREIDYFLRQQKIRPQTIFFRPCYNEAIIQRIILNLIKSYEMLGYPEKIEQLQKLLKITNISSK
jgi:regulator of sirC expression with transglutaminase-like and TPR domain